MTAHSRAVYRGRGRYIDMERAFDWDEVLGMIPAVGGVDVVVPIAGASG